jgi:hypothetical protein
VRLLRLFAENDKGNSWIHRKNGMIRVKARVEAKARAEAALTIAPVISGVPVCRHTGTQEWQKLRSDPRICVEVDFSKAADGRKVPPGAYLETEWADLGGQRADSVRVLVLTGVVKFLLSLFLAHLIPPIQVTLEPRTSSAIHPVSTKVQEEGQMELALTAFLSAKRRLFKNARQNVSIPDGNVDGATSAFDFDPKATSVSEIGMLDIDYKHRT